jgi:hypothetical protein
MNRFPVLPVYSNPLQQNPNRLDTEILYTPISRSISKMREYSTGDGLK